MKKSKLLAPAFAFLALSTAAAVTGTVAWFTASRVVTISASAITAYNPEENLRVDLASASDGATIVRNFDNETSHGENHANDATVTIAGLRDASVDLSDETVYRSILSEDGGTVAGFESVATPYSAGTYKKDASSAAVNIYYAAYYEATFSLVSGASDKTYDLLFDNTRTVAQNPGELALAAGLRIGYIIEESSKMFVVAPFKDSGALQHVVGENSTDLENYASDISFYSGNTGTFTMGQLQGQGSATVDNELVAKVYTWFEGCDSTVINGNVNIDSLLSVALDFRIAEAA